MERKNKAGLAEELKNFYWRVNDSKFVFMDQPGPNGVGRATLGKEQNRLLAI